MTLNEFLIDLVKKGCELKTVYDIGAHKGTWSLETKQLALPNSEFILFEANQNLKNDLTQTGFKFFNGVLSHPDKSMVMFYNKLDGTGNSYYQEQTVEYGNIIPTFLPAYTLDNVIDQNNLPLPDFIKIDTQGSELDILHGSKKSMDMVKLVLTECPLLCYNKNSPNINDYLEFFRLYEMVPMGVNEAHFVDNIAVQLDIIFMKNSVKEQFISPNQTLKVNFK